MATFADSDAFDVIIAGGGVQNMYIKDPSDGQFKQATPSVLVGGVWQPADAYVLVSGVWKPVYEQ